jgi:hypothetical protein
MGRKGKIIMKLVLKNGEIKEVDTSVIFNDQYNTTDGNRVYDTSVERIIDDIRLGEFYTSSVKQGTYDEVAAAIAEKRAKINKCDDCNWFRRGSTLRDECSTETIREGDKVITIERTVYQLACSWKPTHNNKCAHDIEDKPILFREKHKCFFCECPEGVPSIRELKMFMCGNADKYSIVPRWRGDTLGINNSFKCAKQFGSYWFEANYSSDYFTLYNNRNSFKFYVDLKNKRFILREGFGYKVSDTLSTEDYDWDQHKTVQKTIRGYDKFAKWLWEIVDDFNASK